MQRYKKRPVEVHASLWTKQGDHDNVVPLNPSHPDTWRCKICSGTATTHGWVETLEGGHIACSGDWIITGVKGEHYPIKPDIFEDTYDRVEDIE